MNCVISLQGCNTTGVEFGDNLKHAESTLHDINVSKKSVILDKRSVTQFRVEFMFHFEVNIVVVLLLLLVQCDSAVDQLRQFFQVTSLTNHKNDKQKVSENALFLTVCTERKCVIHLGSETAEMIHNTL